MACLKCWKRWQEKKIFQSKQFGIVNLGQVVIFGYDQLFSDPSKVVKNTKKTVKVFD